MKNLCMALQHSLFKLTMEMKCSDALVFASGHVRWVGYKHLKITVTQNVAKLPLINHWHRIGFASSSYESCPTNESRTLTVDVQICQEGLSLSHLFTNHPLTVWRMANLFIGDIIVCYISTFSNSMSVSDAFAFWTGKLRTQSLRTVCENQRGLQFGIGY